jgi:ATP-dependent exoDNAse (exonuclease V) alpha subunit
MQEIENKKFKIEKIVYYDKKSNWGVLATKPIDNLGSIQSKLTNKYGNISVTGNFEGVFEGADVVLSAVIVDGKYGLALQVKSLQVIHDTKTREGIVNFLARSLIKGISVQNALKIYDNFKDKSIDVVFNEPHRLESIKGIGEKTVNKVKESVKDYRRMKPLIDYCTKLGLPYILIKKLDEELGSKALEVIETEPYKVLDLTGNITFRQIDEIYIKSGGKPTATVRLEAGLLYALKNEATLEGSTGLKSSTLKNRFYSLLGLSGENSEYESIVHKLSSEEKVYITEGAITGYETGYVYYKPYVDIERNIAEKIQALNTYGVLGDGIKESVVDEEIHDFPFKLNEKQVEAVHDCLNHNVSVLTGAAGCVAGDTIVKFKIGRQRKEQVATIEQLLDLYKKDSEKKWYVKSYIPVTKEIAWNEIEKVVYSGVKQTYELITEDGKTLRATSDHEILTQKGFKQLKDIKKGEYVMTRYGDSGKALSLVIGKKKAKKEDTYDICCYKNHNFVANGIVVHNSGKSSITKALSNIYARCGFNVQLLSPTAKACRRLEECVGGFQAQTIHKFLGMKKDNEYKAKSSYPPKTVLVIDEASMMDIMLFNNLLLSADLSTRVLVIGDNNQLPSVQAGNVLGDLIDSKKVHVSLLTDVMRQQEDSNIIKFCNKTNNGVVFDPIESKDFHYEEFGEGTELRDFFYQEYIKAIEVVGLNEVQVITPYKKGELGMDNLNTFIQGKYNKDGALTLEPFRIGDKVRHTQNDYKREVFNGETGTIISFDEEEETLRVDFGNKIITYEKQDLADLVLAYCSTVHASQGSEYKIVFVILDDTSVNDFLHIRRLLYTAISRGKQKVYLLSKPYLVDKCIENNVYRPRITKLKDFLNEE